MAHQEPGAGGERRFDRAVQSALGALTAVVLFAMMALTCVDVVGRYLFNRPVPGYAQYRSPIGGLYMCGSSTHPGGGVMGAPGRNAAAEILRDLKTPRKDMSDAYAVL